MYEDSGIQFWHSMVMDRPNWKKGDSVNLGKHILELGREQRENDKHGIERMVMRNWKEYLDTNNGNVAFVDGNGDNVITPTYNEWARRPFMSGLMIYWIEQEYMIQSDMSKGF